MTIINSFGKLGARTVFGFALLLGFAAAATAAPTVTPDVKVYAFIVKKHDISDKEFHSHWRNPHGVLTKKVPQIKRYLQNHGTANPAALEGLPTMPCLGIATIWVADVGKLDDIFHDPGFQDVHADELNLLERSELSWMIAEETVVAQGPAPSDIKRIPTKALLFLKRSAVASPASFKAWVADFAAQSAKTYAGARVTYALPNALAYKDDNKPPYDAVLEIGIQGDAAFKQAWKRHGPATLRYAAMDANIAASRGFLAHEERVIWPAFK